MSQGDFDDKILDLFAGPFRRNSGYFRGRGGEGVLSTVGGGSTGGFEVQLGTQVPFAAYSPSFIMTESKHPRGNRGRDRGDHRSGGIERKDP